MRVAIREQLAVLVVFAVLVALAVVSIPTWVFVNRFVGDVESSSLSLTASLKAARVSSEIDLVQTTCENLASRILIQQSLVNFYQGNHSDSNWSDAEADMQSALSVSGFTNIYQGRLYSRNTSGSTNGLLNVTGQGVSIELPYASPNGSDVYLGDPDFGYPYDLYPNITYDDTGMRSSVDNTTDNFVAYAFPNVRLTNNGGLLLGPLIINSSFALISLTVPIRQNSNQGFILGYMTLIASATTLIDIQESNEGLGKTGVVLFVGPNTVWNRFNASYQPSNNTYVPASKVKYGEVDVQFILLPLAAASGPNRHSQHDYGDGTFSRTFRLGSYPAVLDAFSTRTDSVNNASATLSTTNEQGYHVAVGVARPQSTLVSWAVVVEQDHKEAYATVRTLRKILLGCVFGTAGLVMILTVPCAHLSVKPIRQLKYATEKSIAPPGYTDEDEAPSSATRSTRSRLSEKDWFTRICRIAGLDKKPAAVFSTTKEGRADHEHDGHTIFKIPGKVPEHKHFITDELTELTSTFNAMSEELFKQYESLDEKVAERTRELEISKKAAEAANESKTLFIANISHELKTPLNGIMGMCAVCMEEDDISRIKQSLKTLYKSGDLLLHLLEDLLSFSKNQIGHQVSLEEREFRLGDVRSQVLSIFDKQVREGKIVFSVNYVSFDPYELMSAAGEAAEGTAVATDGAARTTMGKTSERSGTDPQLPALGPPGTGRLKDMCLWGDQQRILQVIINLVSNSLKFTPHGGKVDVRIRCIGEADLGGDDSRTSSFSKSGSHRGGRSRLRLGGSSVQSSNSRSNSNNNSGAVSTSTLTAATYKGTTSGTALSINPLDPKAVPTTFVSVHERSPTPPPAGAKTYMFEFEIQDTGPGIAPQMQEKVFEPFVQGDLGLSKKFGGTGLGLSICQQLATLMGGTITLKSTVGVGSIFTMRIPLKYVKERASSTASSSMKSRPASVSSVDCDSRRNSLLKAAGAESSKAKQAPMLDKQARLVGLSQPFFMANTVHHPVQSAKDQMAAIDKVLASKAKSQDRVRVLVADDNSTNVEVVSRMLKLEDIYNVTIAKDGQEAYDLVKANMEKNQMFDVIFMDIQMPNLDGLQSTRLIRQMGYSAPIVALTAFSEESNVKECMESGMNEFLSKPIRRPALKQVLQKFATIPEEPETASLMRNGTPEKAKPPEGLSIETLDAVQEPDGEPEGQKATPIQNGRAQA
ncbi:osmolarity two-component system protein sln1 [Grosmannia clavigera kw1407]|uniref:histidine kinase n=1 Tax=Grosmannia clavigera (strain kw1407 / UAMH 11150) TaxID=655863 RepID=F0XCN7_GROCL|nr:osmolarity two-component system protein sln1 [Grosmannia clavigera kw1407]EFX03510.1 osmolarity two-component system protein sln1 [Grosmannia clavigera kw1407]